MLMISKGLATVRLSADVMPVAKTNMKNQILSNRKARSYLLPQNSSRFLPLSKKSSQPNPRPKLPSLGISIQLSTHDPRSRKEDTRLYMVMSPSFGFA